MFTWSADFRSVIPLPPYNKQQEKKLLSTVQKQNRKNHCIQGGKEKEKKHE